LKYRKTLETKALSVATLHWNLNLTTTQIEELRQAYDDYVQNKISKLNLTDISAHVSHTQTGSWFWKKQVYTIAIAWTKPLEPTEN
jgi:hypothetical protein